MTLGKIKFEKKTCDPLGKRKDREKGVSKINSQSKPLNRQRKPV
jgi:hypothetical protein